MSSGNYDNLDEALDLLVSYNGAGNHGPMAAEALCALGRGNKVVGWMEHYRKKRLGPPGQAHISERAAPRNPIDRDEWRDALGNFDRLEDWSQFFERELAEASWTDVLDRWVMRLAPGFVAGGMHGPIRTGHAVCSLAERESPARRKELADALGYWAAGFQTLPSRPSTRPGMLPSRAILQVEPQAQHGRPQGLLAWLDEVSSCEPFGEVIRLIDPSIDTVVLLTDLTQTFASTYLANADDLLSVIMLIHAVTGPGAVRMIAPYVSERTLHELFPYAWQAAAGMHAFVGGSQPPETAIVENIDFDPDDLIDRALATGDEHAIKFTEVCLREHALNPNSAYTAAAPHAVDVIASAFQ